MRNLIKTDFKKILTDKLLIIAFAVSIGLAFFIPAVYFALQEVSVNTNNPLMFSVRDIAMPSSFNIVSDVGLLVIVFITLIIGKEFSNGNIRNKIIVGNKRRDVYISLFIVTYVTLVGLMILSTIIMTLTGLIFFPYDIYGSTTGDIIGSLFIGLLIGIITISFVVALSCFFTIALNNVALGIVTPILLFFLLTFIQMAELPNWVYYINVENTLTTLGTHKYDIEEVLLRLLPTIIFTPTLLISGIAIFNKKDLK